MSDTAAFLAKLSARDIRLAVDGDRLRVDAPKGTLDADLREELGRRKAELVAHIRALAARPGNGAESRLAPALRRVPREASMPVSHMQQRLWFIRQTDPGSFVYNIAAAMRMTGALDLVALKSALAALVGRHESFRTRFETIGGEPRCTVEAHAEVVLEFFDLGDLAASGREEAMHECLRTIAQRPFDIARAPLLHAGVIRLSRDEHVFTFTLDHIVADGLSLGIFLAEFQALYAHHAAGAPLALPDLPVQYLDHAQWERERFAAGALDAHVAFWKRRLAGLPAMLPLPTDRPRPPVQTSRGARAVAQLPLELGERVKSFGRQEGLTLFMVMLAAFEVLLHRHSGEDDIAIGTAVANRSRAEIENVIGFFANNLVLRGDLSGDPTGSEVLARVRNATLEAYAHQEMPFDLLVEVLGTRRALDHSPLFQVMFVLQKLDLVGLELPQLRCDMIEYAASTARFDLAVDVFDLKAGLRVYFEYNTDLFDAATVERMLGHYVALLDGLVSHPQERVGRLPMLAPSERQALLQRGSGPAGTVPPQPTVHGLFEARAERSPEAIAVRFEGTSVTYGELDARSNRLARHLRDRGVGRESRVGIWMERSPDMVVALLGVLKAGAAYVPLDPAFPRERIAFMMSDAALAVVVTQSHLADTLEPGGPVPVRMDGDAAILERLPPGALAASADGGDLAYVLYTSGSTGRPKGVQVEHRAVVNFLGSMHREPGIGAHDRFVAVTTLSFDIAGLEILGPLTAGGTVVLASRADALDGTRLAGLLESGEATILQATPATWKLLLECGWRGRPGLKMLCGGEAMPRDLAARLLATGGELWNLYGPTETTIWSTVARVTDASRSIPIGRPIDNTQAWVLEPSGLPAPIGVGGELCIGGEGLARGYRNRPDLTAEKFVTIDLPGVGPRRVYRTGDVVRFLADGQLDYLGRRDHQVKVRGFRIELGEIEAVLATHPGVQACVAHVREDSPGDQRLVGYVIAGGGAFDASAARDTLRAKLPDYMIPNHFVELEALPLTPNGKIDRKSLPPPKAPAAPADRAPMTPAQRRVAGSWEQVLGIEQPGLESNFFDVGGHSLLLVKLQAALQREFGREITLVELFQHTTVAAQAARLTGSGSADSALQRAQARATKLHGR